MDPAAVTGMHVSGHGYQEDLKLMLTLMKPKYFIPIHGEYRMLHQHRLLAESVGVEKENTFIINNGDVVDISIRLPARLEKSLPEIHLSTAWGSGMLETLYYAIVSSFLKTECLSLLLTISKTENKMVLISDTPSLVDSYMLEIPKHCLIMKYPW